MSQHYQNPAFYQAFMSSYHRTVSSNRLRDTRWELISINGQSWTYKKSKHFPKHTAQHAAVLSDESINRTQRSKFFSLCMHDFSFKYSVVQWSSFSLSIKETRNGPQWNSSFLSLNISQTAPRGKLARLCQVLTMSRFVRAIKQLTAFPVENFSVERSESKNARH